MPISHTRDTAGPMTRSVADCALLDGVVTGGATGLAAAPLKGLRLGVPRGHFWENLDAELGAILEDELARLRDAGVVLVEGDVADVGAARRRRRLSGRALRDRRRPQRLSAPSTALASTIAGLVAQVREPGRERHACEPARRRRGARGGLPRSARQASPGAAGGLSALLPRARRRRAMVFPTTPMPAAKIGEDETVDAQRRPRCRPSPPTSATPSPGSVAGIPGLSLPAGMTRGGLAGRASSSTRPECSDHQLLAIGLARRALLPKTAGAEALTSTNQQRKHRRTPMSTQSGTHADEVSSAAPLPAPRSAVRAGLIRAAARRRASSRSACSSRSAARRRCSGRRRRPRAELAVEEINKAGGIMGRQIELLSADGGGRRAEAAKSAVRLMLEDKVDLFIGSHDSATREALVATIKGKVPYIYTPVYEGGECSLNTYVHRRHAAAADPAGGRRG